MFIETKITEGQENYTKIQSKERKRKRRKSI